MLKGKKRSIAPDSDNMKIMVISTVAYGRNGIATVIRNLYANARFAGEKITFMFPLDGDPDRIAELEALGYDVIREPSRLRRPAGYFIRLVKELRQRRIQIVHIHGNSGTCALEALAAKLAGVPAVMMHNHTCGCKYMLAHKLLRPVLNGLVDHRFACSQEAGTFLFGQRECTVIPNGFAVERYAFSPAVRQRLRRAYDLDGKIVLGHVGIFSPVKNQKFLIDILEAHLKKHENTVLMMAGHGEQLENVRQAVRSRNLEDHVIFLGTVDHVADLLNAFDYFVFPSVLEGLGIAPMEAQANGLPVLAASEGIPKGVKINSNFHFLPLAAGAKKWSELLASIPCERDADGVSNVKNAGYDLTEAVADWHTRMKNILKE